VTAALSTSDSTTLATPPDPRHASARSTTTCKLRTSCAIVESCLEEVREWKVYSRPGWGSQIAEPRDRCDARAMAPRARWMVLWKEPARIK
jgi:hypothetical protein